MPTIEAQLMPHVAKWLESQDTSLVALGLVAYSHAIEYSGSGANKGYITAVLPMMLERALPGSEDVFLKESAAAGLGAVAQHGGKLLNRNAATDVALKMLAMLQV